MPDPKALDQIYNLTRAALMLGGNDLDRDMVIGAEAIVGLGTSHSDKAKRALVDHAMKKFLDERGPSHE